MEALAARRPSIVLNQVNFIFYLNQRKENFKSIDTPSALFLISLLCLFDNASTLDNMII